GHLLRLPDEAAAVPGSLSRKLPARRDQPRRDDPARGTADSAMTLYRRILRYLLPHSSLFGISIVAMIVFAALDAFSFTLLMPFLSVLFEGGGLMGTEPGTGGLIERLLAWSVGDMIDGAEPMVALRNVVLLLFLVFLVKNVALYIQQYTIMMLEGRVTRDLRNEVYGHLLTLGFPFFQRTRTGQIISRLTMDVDQIRALVTANLARAASSLIQVIVFLVVLLLLSWKLTLVAALFLPPMMGLWARFRERLRVGVLQVLDA